MPASARSSVVFPAPLGPMRPSSSPPRSVRVTSRIAVKDPKRTRTCWAARSGGMSPLPLFIRKGLCPPARGGDRPSRREQRQQPRERKVPLESDLAVAPLHGRRGKTELCELAELHVQRHPRVGE